MFNWALAILTVLVVSCASTPHICKSRTAEEAGHSQAMEGKPMNLTVGSVCQGEEAKAFRENFEAGYKRGQEQYCDPSGVRQRIRARAENGEVVKFERGSYQICDPQIDLEPAHKEGIRQGTDTFCSAAKSYELGYKEGDRGGPSVFPKNRYDLCGPSPIPGLKKAYNTGYQKGLENFCRASSLQEAGLEDASNGMARADLKSKYRACGSKRTKEILTQYDESYNKGLEAFCKERDIEAQAKNDAEQMAQFTLPARYSVCFSRYPHLVSLYKKEFEVRREDVISSECSYQRGLDRGRQDAQLSNQKNIIMPTFCNSALYPIFMSGYLEGWANTKKDFCDFDRAYQEGIHRAQSGQPAIYSPDALCPDEMRLQVQQKFTEGYQAGKIMASPKGASAAVAD